MRFWFDTEFIDNCKTIELISIGIISEDNREYYAISSEFDSSTACDWVKTHILPQLESSTPRKSRKQIKQDIIQFIGNKKPEFWVYNGAYDWVILCRLFGHIHNLPKGYPWYANDIKQLIHMLGYTELPPHPKNKHHALEDAKWAKSAWEVIMANRKFK